MLNNNQKPMKIKKIPLEIRFNMKILILQFIHNLQKSGYSCIFMIKKIIEKS